MVLVLRAVDGRDLPLAEGVIKRVVDRVQGKAEAHRGVAVDDHVGLQAALLLIGIDVLEDVAFHQRRGQLRRPLVQFRRVVGEQRVLIGSIALPAAGPQIGHRDHEEARARHLGELAAKPRHDPVGRDPPLREGLQRDVDEAELVCRPPVNPTTLATAGSSRTIVCNCPSFFCIDWNEML